MQKILWIKLYLTMTFYLFIITTFLPNFSIVFMARLRTWAKNKLNKALVRVEKVILMEMRRNIEQQRKRKAKVMNSRTMVKKDDIVVA